VGTQDVAATAAKVINIVRRLDPLRTHVRWDAGAYLDIMPKITSGRILPAPVDRLVRFSSNVRHHSRPGGLRPGSGKQSSTSKAKLHASPVHQVFTNDDPIASIVSVIQGLHGRQSGPPTGARQEQTGHLRLQLGPPAVGLRNRASLLGRDRRGRRDVFYAAVLSLTTIPAIPGPLIADGTRGEPPARRG
jgi:hypothetical protein